MSLTTLQVYQAISRHVAELNAICVKLSAGEITKKDAAENTIRFSEALTKKLAE